VPAVQHHVHLVTGVNLMELERYEQAIESLVLAIEAQPEFARAHMALGASLAKLGREGEAIVHFERAAASDPRNPDTYYNIGFACMAAGLPVRAIAAFEGALELVPVFEDARRGLKAAQKQKAQYGAEIRRRLAGDAKDADNQFRLSVLYDGLGEEARAVKHLGLSVELEPESAGRTARLAWRLATSGDPAIRDGKRALSLARRAVSIAGEPNPFGLDILAAALAESGDYEAAVATAEKAVTLAKKRAPAYGTEVARRLELYRQGKPYRTGGGS
jgi:tetratricopeptide (TPR) repeat protein